MRQILLVAPILIPLAAASLTALLWSRPAAQRAVGLVAAIALFVATLVLLAEVVAGGMVVGQMGNWPAPFGITMVVDHLSAAMLAITRLMGLAVAVYAMGPGARERDRAGFQPLFHALLMGVAECQAAGIRVKMITGDHAATAGAIAREVGLRGAGDVATGAELDTLDAAAFRARARQADVFARTSPEHKLRLVEALQAEGGVVAMTGDGVNDAAALKRADVGVAMGRKGTEAAKEASEMVLADDNFATIATAVQEGRTVYDNLRKVIAWTLPTNGGEALTIVAAILLGLTLPLTPVQILWVNMVTAVTLGLVLAFEPAEAGIMRRPPRPPRGSVRGGGGNSDFDRGVGLGWPSDLAARVEL